MEAEAYVCVRALAGGRECICWQSGRILAFLLPAFLVVCDTESYCGAQDIFMMHFKVTSRALRACG